MDPRGLAGITAWYDAADTRYLTLDSNRGISLWNTRVTNPSGDVSVGNSGAPAARPLWVPHLFGPGRPGARFDGTDDWLSYQSGATLARWYSATEHTIASVVRFRAVATDSTDPSQNDAIVSNFGGHHSLHARSSGLLGVFQFDSAYRKIEATYRIGTVAVVLVWKTGGTMFLAVNGTLAGSIATGSLLTTASGLYFGRQSSTTNYVEADLGDLLTFNVALSAADRADLVAYLARKYLPPTLPVALRRAARR